MRLAADNVSNPSTEEQVMIVLRKRVFFLISVLYFVVAVSGIFYARSVQQSSLVELATVYLNLSDTTVLSSVTAPTLFGVIVVTADDLQYLYKTADTLQLPETLTELRVFRTDTEFLTACAVTSATLGRLTERCVILSRQQLVSTTSSLFLGSLLVYLVFVAGVYGLRRFQPTVRRPLRPEEFETTDELLKLLRSSAKASVADLQLQISKLISERTRVSAVFAKHLLSVLDQVVADRFQLHVTTEQTSVATALFEEHAEGFIVFDDALVIRMLNPKARRLLPRILAVPPTESEANLLPEVIGFRATELFVADFATLLLRFMSPEHERASTVSGSFGTGRPVYYTLQRLSALQKLVLTLSEVPVATALDLEVPKRFPPNSSASIASLLSRGVLHDVQNHLSILSNHLNALKLRSQTGQLQLLHLEESFEPMLCAVDNSSKILQSFRRALQGISADASESSASASAVLTDALQVTLLGTQIIYSLSCEASALDVKIAMPPLMLYQVLSNLFLNSRQACGLTGEIAVHYRLATDPQSGVEGCQLVIKDTGPGIADEVAKQLFTPGVTTKTSGSGLGLASIRELLAVFGGTIMYVPPDTEIPCESSGAEFELFLPVQKLLRASQDRPQFCQKNTVHVVQLHSLERTLRSQQEHQNFSEILRIFGFQCQYSESLQESLVSLKTTLQPAGASAQYLVTEVTAQTFQECLETRFFVDLPTTLHFAVYFVDGTSPMQFADVPATVVFLEYPFSLREVMTYLQVDELSNSSLADTLPRHGSMAPTGSKMPQHLLQDTGTLAEGI